MSETGLYRVRDWGDVAIGTACVLIGLAGGLGQLGSISLGLAGLALLALSMERVRLPRPGALEVDTA